MSLRRRPRLIQDSKENLETAIKWVAKKLRIKREYIMVGIFFLLISAISIFIYSKSKKWDIYGPHVPTGKKPLTVNLSDGDSPLQKMSDEIRDSIHTPMAEASSQSQAQSASGMKAARSDPQNTASQSAMANSANTSASVSGSGASGSFSPSVSGSRAAASGVMSGQARAETSQSMSMASLQSQAQSASGMKAARSDPQNTASQSAMANSANTSASVSGSGASGSFSPSVSGSRAAASGVMSGQARAEAGRGMSGASTRSLAQAATGAQGAARNSPSSLSGRSSGSARAANTSASVSGSGASGSFSPSVSGSRAAAGRGMSGALSDPSLQIRRSRLGGDAANTDQVMIQVDSQSMARQVSFGGARRRPRSAYVARIETSESSVSPVEVAVAKRTNSQRSFVPTVTTVHRTLPTIEEAQPEQPKAENPFEMRTSPELRADFVRQQGGGPETESAVARALEWLKRNQWKDGHWNHRSGHSTAATGLAMLAYMGWGAKHTEPGPYQETLSKAVDWMLSKERNGDLRYRGDMYDHGIAAIALAEAYNLTKDEKLREPVKRLVAFTVRAQNKETGGWRYKTYAENPRDKGDLSVSGWQLMVLKSARLGGMDVPNAPFVNALKFIDNAGVGEKGFQYRPGHTPSLAMIAEGLFCEQILRGREANPQMEQCIGLIQKKLPSTRTVDYYYWYYGSLAMRQTQGKAWENWNEKLKPILLGKQKRGGTNDGSWNPEGKNGSIAGRCVTTAMAALSLEVYYRYLPLSSPEWSKKKAK